MLELRPIRHRSPMVTISSLMSSCPGAMPADSDTYGPMRVSRPMRMDAQRRWWEAHDRPLAEGREPSTAPTPVVNGGLTAEPVMGAQNDISERVRYERATVASPGCVT